MKITKRRLKQIIKEELGRGLLRENIGQRAAGVRIQDDGYRTQVDLIGPEPDVLPDPDYYWPEDAEALETIEWESGDLASPQLTQAMARWGDMMIIDDPRGLADTNIPMRAWLENYIEEFEGY